MPKPCGVPTKDRHCEDPKDKEMGDGFCTDHSHAWRQSKEFREATKDEAVGFAASLRIPSMLRSALRPHKKRWQRRLADEFDRPTSEEP
jgi:hypothetical protein